MKKSLIIVLVLVLALAALVTAAGCGESPAQAKANLTTAVNNFKTSLQTFTNPSTYTSKDSLTKALNDAKSTYNKMIASAKKVTSVDVNTLKSSWTQFTKSITNFDVNNVSQSAADIQKAYANMQAAWTEVLNSLK
jgi:hypothetical protein